MTPNEFMLAVLCYCGAAAACVVTLLVVGCAIFAAFVFTSWLANLFRDGGPQTSRGVYSDGTPATIVRFPTGQVGVAPSNSVPRLDSEYGNRP